MKLIEQKFIVDKAVITICRDNETGIIKIAQGLQGESEQILSTPVEVMHELLEIMRNSPFIFSKNNN